MPLSRLLLTCLLLVGAAGGLAGAHEAHTNSEVLTPSLGAMAFDPPQPGSYTLPVLGAARDGTVLDEEGTAERLHALYADRIVLLAFVFSSCTDAKGCPLALAVLNQVKSRFELEQALWREARLLTLSFDPERDTPAVMQAYGAGFHTRNSDWRFLTTASTSELTPILEAYGQPIQREYDAEGRATGQFAHVLRVFLIDKQRRIRNVYSSSFLHADLLLNDVRTLLLEEHNGGAAPLAKRSVRGEAPVDLRALAERPSLGLPALPVPADNSLTTDRIALGRKLFFDRRLSHNGTISCAMCHIPEQGFTNRELATAVGIEGRTVRRNAPTLYNVGYAERLLHDGRERRLERQVWGPLLARNEMGNPAVGTVLERLEALPDYEGLFEQAFAGRGPGMETLGMALASYERTLIAGNSPFDRWHFAGETDALSTAAVRGFRLFSTVAACVSCHRIDRETALFTDHRMHNTGIGYQRSMGTGPARQRIEIAPGTYVELEGETLESISETPPSDLGLYEITLDPRDRWRYKTPSLRNVALTPPYMHDGSLATLRQVVDFYNAGGIQNETLDPLMRPLGLSGQEVEDLVAFLESLSGDNVDLLVRDALSAPIGDPR